MRSEISKKIIANVVGYGAFLALAWYVYAHLGEFQRLLQLSPLKFVVLSLLVLLTMAFTTLKQSMLFKLLDIKEDLIGIFAFNSISTLVNLLPFNAALIFRATYVKKRFNTALYEFGIGTIVGFITFFIASVFLCILSFGIMQRTQITLFLEKQGALFWIALFCVLSFLFIVVLCRKKTVCRGVSEKVSESKIYKLKKITLTNLPLIGMMFLVDFGSSLIWALRFFFTSHYLGFRVSFLQCAIFQGVNCFLLLLTFLPAGAIGFREALLGLTVKNFGGKTSDGVIISMVDRVVAILWILIFGFLSLQILKKRTIMKKVGIREDLK
ncbi:lysylphosphatidylglycerol synthase domain-containing protein [Candidatus Omnitrophota bacterium]